MSDKREYQIGDVQMNSGRGRGPGGGGPMVMSGEKAGDFLGSVGKLLRYCSRYLPAIIAASVLVLAGVATSLVGPGLLADLTRVITNGLGGEIDVQAAAGVAFLLAGIYAAGFVFNAGQGFIMATVSQRIAQGLRADISAKINRLPLSYFDKHPLGDTLSRATNDVDTIGTTFNQVLGSFVSAVVMFVGCMVMMFVTNWVMALVGVLSTVIGFALMMTIISRSQKHFMRQQNGLGAINGHIEETFAAHTVVKAYNGEAEARQTFAQLNGALYDSAWKSQFLSGLMQPLMSFIGNLGYVAVCVAGAVLTMQGAIGFEVIVAFMLYIRLFTQLLGQISQVATSLQSAAAGAERVFAFLEEPGMAEEPRAQLRPQDVRGEVDFEHVGFGYEEGQEVVRDFSAHVKPGQKVAIVGPTGAGKTTMVNLLMRFYDAGSGRICIDGVDVADLSRGNVHELFGMVLQDAWVFEGTVADNVRYAKLDATDEDVVAACKAVGLHHFVTTLPHGYDTVLAEDGSLSAGQKQLVTIARAMVEDAPILILDEATSSVDTRTEAIIQAAMDKLMAGRTSFVIAHRLSTVRNADLILVMDRGDIVESGTHDELIARGGFYADLYNSQFQEAA